MDTALAARIEAMTGSRPLRSQRLRTGGYTRAGKWTVEFADGSRVFVKESAEPLERVVYEQVKAPFLPRLIGADEGLLVLDDLTDALWPPPYPDDVSALFITLDALAATAPPAALPELPKPSPGLWERLIGYADRLTGLGACSAEWLEQALPQLIAAEARFAPAGDSLVHGDIYSGNLCFTGGRSVLVDWACARRGNHWFDRGMAWISVEIEGGRAPALDAPDEATLAAFIAGDWALSLTHPRPSSIDPDAGLEAAQLNDLRHGLSWFARAAGLPPPA